MFESLGFTQARWSAWEAGKARPNLEDFIKIAQYFNVSETDLLHGNFFDDDSVPTQHNFITENAENLSHLEKLLDCLQDEIQKLKQQLQCKKL